MAERSITYLFDPLCGWCYGASPALGELQDAGVAIMLNPTGLFAGENARAVDAMFATYAWSQDQRIAELSGQSFTQAYRDRVLGATGACLDSSAATLALTAVAQDEPERELEVLRVIQVARYGEGRDIISAASLSQILSEAGFSRVAEQITAPSLALVNANRDRIARGRSLMTSVGARGVPTLVISDRDGVRAVGADALFGGVDRLLIQLETA
jgi:putative protein-disulfide isomerase